MILSDVLGGTVVDASGRRVGRVTDVRLRLDGRSAPAAARLVGFVVSPRTSLWSLGYERRRVTRPVIIARVLRALHRGSFVVAWSDVARIDAKRLVLRAGYERGDVSLGD